MKNILFGLISISMISFAAAPTLTDTPDNNKPVFQTGQTGEILVKGTMKTNPEVVKYVVYSSDNGDYTGTADQQTWTWPTITIGRATSDDGTLGFSGQTAPKLYVKKVNGDSTNVLPLTSETVSYKLNIDPELEKLSNTALIKGFTSTFNKTYVTVFSLSSKADLDSLVSQIGNGITFEAIPNNTDNYPVRAKVGSADFNGSTAIMIERESLGVLKVYTDFSATNTAFSKTVSDSLLTHFATPRNGFSGLSISVKVN